MNRITLIVALLFPASVNAQQAQCQASVNSLSRTHPHLRCTCRSAHSVPDCSDSRNKSTSGPSHSGSSRKKKGGMSLGQQTSLMLMQGFLDGMLRSMQAPPKQAAKPAAPPPPQYAANPVYAEALRKFEEFRRPDGELRRALIDQLAQVPRENLPPKTPDLPKQLLLSACLGKHAVRSPSDEESELLLRQSAQAMEGSVFPVSMRGCDAPEPPMPSVSLIEKRRKAAELAADLFAEAGELEVRSAQSQERASRAEAALAEASKIASTPTEDDALLRAAREQEAAARRELEEARAEAERLKREAEEASKKGRSVADRLDKAGGEEGELDALFKEFGDGR